MCRIVSGRRTNSFVSRKLTIAERSWYSRYCFSMSVRRGENGLPERLSPRAPKPGAMDAGLARIVPLAMLTALCAHQVGAHGSHPFGGNHAATLETLTACSLGLLLACMFGWLLRSKVSATGAAKSWLQGYLPGAGRPGMLATTIAIGGFLCLTAVEAAEGRPLLASAPVLLALGVAGIVLNLVLESTTGMAVALIAALGAWVARGDQTMTGLLSGTVQSFRLTIGPAQAHSGRGPPRTFAT